MENKSSRKRPDSYVDYNLSTLKNSHGGYFVEATEANPDTAKELAQRLKRIQYNKPFTLTTEQQATVNCVECKKSSDIDLQFYAVFNVQVCYNCKRANPEKYSLLTKTEVKQDYMLTDGELRDVEELPRILKPNPLKSTYSNMMLFLKMNVEEYAKKKYSSLEDMDAEYFRRTTQKLEAKERRSNAKLLELRKRIRSTKPLAERIERMRPHDEHDFVQEGGKSKCRICGVAVVIEEI